jgi:hypothetical protein
VVSVSVTKSNLKAAAFCEAVGRFYAGAVSGAFSAVGRTLPVGLATDGKMPEDALFTVPLAKVMLMAPGLQPRHREAQRHSWNATHSQCVYRQRPDCIVVLAACDQSGEGARLPGVGT